MRNSASNVLRLAASHWRANDFVCLPPIRLPLRMTISSLLRSSAHPAMLMEAEIMFQGKTGLICIIQMTTMPKGIENTELLESIFGCWPSFHDAEIRSIVITRDCDSGPQMDILIHHWQMTSEVDSKGYYILKNHTLTTMRFSNISDLLLADFNGQNVLGDIEISQTTGPDSESMFSVSLPTSYGCEASFKCRRIRIISAIPFTKT